MDLALTVFLAGNILGAEETKEAVVAGYYYCPVITGLTKDTGNAHPQV